MASGIILPLPSCGSFWDGFFQTIGEMGLRPGFRSTGLGILPVLAAFLLIILLRVRQPRRKRSTLLALAPFFTSILSSWIFYIIKMTLFYGMHPELQDIACPGAHGSAVALIILIPLTGSLATLVLLAQSSLTSDSDNGEDTNGDGEAGRTRTATATATAKRGGSHHYVG